MYRALILPSKIKGTLNYLEAARDNWSGPPYGDYYEDYGVERQHEFSLLGLYAARLSNDFRKEYKIPVEKSLDENPHWNTTNFLEEKVIKSKKFLDKNHLQAE